MPKRHRQEDLSVGGSQNEFKDSQDHDKEKLWLE